MRRGAGLSGRVGPGRAHRLFSPAAGEPAALADALTRLVVALLVPADQQVRRVVDDTLLRRRGKEGVGRLGGP